MRLRIGIVDTGVNAWHSHVRGRVSGCRIYVAHDGSLAEDGDYRDPFGHGTAIAGIVREAFPDAELIAVRVFDGVATYPSLVARGILRAAAAGCEFVNVSVAIPPGPGTDAVERACAAAQGAGCTLVAPASPEHATSLPASLPGVWVVGADDALAEGDVRVVGPRRLAAAGHPRDLRALPREGNLAGHSFACARGLVHLARQRHAAGARTFA